MLAVANSGRVSNHRGQSSVYSMPQNLYQYIIGDGILLSCTGPSVSNCVCLFDLIMSQSPIFQLCWDGSSRVEPVLSKDKSILLKDTTQ